MPLNNVSDDHLDLVLDAAAEKYRRMRQSQFSPEEIDKIQRGSQNPQYHQVAKPGDNRPVPIPNQLIDKDGNPIDENGNIIRPVPLSSRGPGSLRPMVKPEDLANDYQQQEVTPPAQAADTIHLAPGRSEQDMNGMNMYMNDRNMDKMREENAIPGQDIPGGASRGPAGIFDNTIVGRIKNAWNSATGATSPTNPAVTPQSEAEKAAVSNGATSDQVVSTSPSVNDSVALPTFDTEKINPIAKQEVPELAPSESIKKAASDIANQKETPYKTLLKLNQAKAQGDYNAAEEAVKQSDIISSNMPILQQRQKELYAKIDAQTDAINEMTKVDPNRIWNNGNVGNKIGFLVSAAFGGLQTGGALDSLIKNDIAAQVKNAEIGSENNRGVLNAFLKQGDNMREAIQNTMAYYPHLIKAYHDLAAAGVALTPEAVNAASVKDWNATNKVKVDMSTDLAKVDLERQKANTGIKESNARFAQEAQKNKQEQEKYTQSKTTFTPAAGEVAQHYKEAKDAIDQMVPLESKGIKRVSMDSLLADADFRARAAHSFNAGAFKGIADEMAKRLLPEVKDSAQRSDLAKYYTLAFRFAAANTKASGAKISKDTIDQFMRMAVPEPGLSPKALAEFQLNRAKDVSNIAVKGGPAAVKIIKNNNK